jgi:hypothetical protein
VAAGDATRRGRRASGPHDSASPGRALQPPIGAVPERYRPASTPVTRHDARVTQSPNVDVSGLRRAVGRLQDVVEGQHGPTIELGTDHYWMLRDEAAFDMATEPTAEGIVAGQLSDDVDAVHELLERSQDEVTVWHDLRHVIGVLSRIAAQDRP